MNTDKTIRLLGSIFYRFILVTYGWTILLSNNNNFFSLYFHIAFTLIFWIIYYKCFNKNQGYSTIRLFNDFLFIAIVLYKKELVGFTNIIFLLLPIFNSPNHSNQKRSIFIPYFIILILAFFLKNTNFHWLEALALFSLLIIDLFEHFRSRVFHLNSSILSEIDYMSLQNIEIGKTHKIYKIFIDFINNSKFQHLVTLEDIMCFTFENNKLKLFNSFNFILDYEFDLGEKDIDKIKKLTMIEDITVKINKILIDKSISIPINTNGTTYLFILKLKPTNSWRFFIFKNATYDNFKPILSKFAGYIDASNRVKKIDRETAEKYSKHLTYMNDTIFAMHFVRNKLTPVINYFEYIAELNKSKTSIERTFWSNLIYNDAEKNNGAEKKAKEALRIIQDKTNQILDISQHPFIVSELSRIKLKALIAVIRTAWYSEFDSDSIELSELSNMLDNLVETNVRGLEILLTDIVANVKKYSNSFQLLDLSGTENDFKVKFLNDVNYLANSEKTRETLKLVLEFNNEKILEFKQKTHGLNTIKTFLKQMKIENVLSFKDDKFELLLTFFYIKP